MIDPFLLAAAAAAGTARAPVLVGRPSNSRPLLDMPGVPPGPPRTLPEFFAFNVSSSWFAIVSRARYAAGSVPGGGAVPYIRTGDLDAVRARLAGADGQASAINEKPGIRLLKDRDPSAPATLDSAPPRAIPSRQATDARRPQT